ncbi:stage V sporulation protein D [Clostridium senegalense]|uniref:stage V sporulation protein D n=1 Tax=Clostridium senegalense TaxID=1465809 RepID=UPI000288FE65|nr:stage V sporulation protein D [Clostridium senegalense]
MAKSELRDKIKIKKRVIGLISLAFVIFITLIIRLSYIMIVKGDDYKDRAIVQWTSDVRVSAKRGRILDRDENELAVSANVYRVDLDLNALRDSLESKKLTMEDIAPDVAEILDMEPKKALKIMTKRLPNGKLMGSAILKRRVEKEAVDKINAYQQKKDIIGFVITPDTKRYYPNNNFASHVLGHTNSDGDGLTGVELYYNKYLSGVPGIKIDELDTKDESISNSISNYTKPVDGKDVVLTLDENMQFFADKAASQALEDNSAKAVSVVIMDPNNGEILAMTNKPDYNPNSPWQEGLSNDETQKVWRNRCISDTFEPGSIFKVVTATAAIETGNVKENDSFVCSGGMTVGGRNIHCWKRIGHGTLTFQEIIKNSCNVGFMTLAERMGKENLSQYIEKFGFGKKTGVDLPGEASGIIKPVDKITTVDLATISFGQSNTLSIMQYMQAFNSIANGGKLITPHVMKEIIHYEPSGEKVIDSTYEPKIIEGNFKEETMKQMRDNLEATISSGGGSKCYIEGYKIGGKTGTAQKVVNGVYGQGKYVSSFAGMFPADNPKVTVFVSIDEPDPSMYYAGQIAAPVGKMIFTDIANYLGVKPEYSEDSDKGKLKDVSIPEIRGVKKQDGVKILKDLGLKYRVEGEGEFIVDINPKPGISVKEETELLVYVGNGEENDEKVLVPDITGLTPEKAENILKEIGLEVEFQGEGLVIEQSIAKNQIVSKGTVITAHLSILDD